VPKFLIYIIIIVPVVFICLGTVLYIFQERLIFYPEKLSNKYQFRFELPFEEKTYTTDDNETISALLFKADSAKGIVYYHHGNAGNMESWGQRAIDFTSRGYDVLMYDYRGYGKSTGKIKNEKMMYNDALMIYKELLYDYKERDIVIYGMSLGTGVAAKLAHDNHPRFLILETPYYNFYDVSKYHYPFLPNSILLHYKFRTDKWVSNVNFPVYLFHGTEDETVPHNSSERLAKLSDNITLFSIKDGSHNNLNTFHKYHEELDFIFK
jgi:uncharacterized protein